MNQQRRYYCTLLVDRYSTTSTGAKESYLRTCTVADVGAACHYFYACYGIVVRRTGGNKPWSVRGRKPTQVWSNFLALWKNGSAASMARQELLPSSTSLLPLSGSLARSSIAFRVLKTDNQIRMRSWSPTRGLLKWCPWLLHPDHQNATNPVSACSVCG